MIITNSKRDIINWWEKKRVPWDPWFAWRPVKDIHGHWHWLKKVYRRTVWVNTNTFNTHYGTIMDVLKDD